MPGNRRPRTRTWSAPCAVALASLVVVACSSRSDGASMILATTTSTYDSGLLDVLVPPFEREQGVTVKVIAVGSGRAIEMGRLGEADVLLVHSPAAEEKLVASGCASSREPVMYNHFLVVGPPDDPAGLRATKSVTAAFAALRAKGAVFVSRGDDSGTHARERRIWSKSGPRPEGDRYIESGQGMGATLRMASEKRAYTLTDVGTYLALRDTLDLEPVVEAGELLKNPYHVITISKRCGKRVRVEPARRFAEYLRSKAVQRQIAEFGRAQQGRSLFVPNADGPR